MLVKPELDIHNVPEFYATFFSEQYEYKIERTWVLQLLVDGEKNLQATDYNRS